MRHSLRRFGGALAALGLLSACLGFQAQAALPRGTRLGWGDSDRHYPAHEKPLFEREPFPYAAWKGETVSALALLWSEEPLQGVSVQAGTLRCGKTLLPDGTVRASLVSAVTGDRLDEQYRQCSARDTVNWQAIREADLIDKQTVTDVPAGTLQCIWLRVDVPADAPAGRYQGSLILHTEGGTHALPYSLRVGNRTLTPASERPFHLDLWQNPYAAARYLNVPLWSEAHFAAMRPIMEYLASAGEKIITTSIIQHPWNSQTEDPFESMIGKYRRIDGTWRYDYTVFDRWVEFMMDCGITEQIDCYTILPWHLTFEYYSEADNCTHSEVMQPGTEEYEDYLLPFLTDFAAHLKAKGWFGKACIAMDERPKEQLEPAYEIIFKADPDFRVKGAINYFGPEVAERMYDISFMFRHPVLEPELLSSHLDKGNRITFYTCCNPDRPNTFLKSSPAESAVMGWQAAATGYNGYLRWAYNSWVKDPCVDARFRTWTAGDCFLVYPDAPSIRMERLIEGIQDYEKVLRLRPGLTARQAARLDAQLKKFLEIDWDAIPENEVIDLVNESKALLRSFE